MPNSTVKKPQRSNSKSTSNTHLAKTTDKLISSVGTQIFWDFHGKSWTTENLKALASACMLKINIKDIPVTNGMHNAVSIWKGRSDKGMLSAKKVHMDSDVYTFGILEVEIDENGKKAKGVQIDKVVYDATSKTFLAKGNTSHSQSLCDAIDHRVTHYTGNEFRKWIIMEFLSSVHSIKMMGGAYFVGSQHNQEIESFSKFCEACGVTLHLLELSGSAKTKSGVAAIAKQGINERIEDLSKKLDIMKKRKRVRSDGREGAKKEIDDIRFLAIRLQKMLSANTEDIDKLLYGLDSELESINNQQPTETQTSNKVLQIWRNAMKPEFRLGNGNYKIAFTDFDQFLIPKTASNKFYWKPDQRLGLALAELGFIGKVSKTHLLLKPLT